MTSELVKTWALFNNLFFILQATIGWSYMEEQTKQYDWLLSLIITYNLHQTKGTTNGV